MYLFKVSNKKTRSICEVLLLILYRQMMAGKFKEANFHRTNFCKNRFCCILQELRMGIFFLFFKEVGKCELMPFIAK